MDIKYTIGYIDEDKKQVGLYTRKLREFGFEVIGYEFHKGMSLENLMKQVYESDIDLLMIDFKLNETNIVAFNGEAVESDIYDKKPLFPHIIFTNKVEQAEPFVEDWKIIYDKDEIFTENEGDDAKVLEFVTMLTKSIDQYKNHISKKKALLSDLLLKAERDGLSAIEKDELLTIQDSLNSLDITKKAEIPKHLISIGNLENLEKTRHDAEKFLQSLLEKK